MANTYDALILGGGAAGLLCAIEAGKRGRRVAVLERAARVGKKILISGGGRCNFTNLHCRSDNFISANPHFAKSALARYTPADFIALVQNHSIPYHEKTLGQLFCDRAARDITDMLEAECRAVTVDIFLNTAILEVRHSTEFAVSTGNTELSAPTLVVATGGLTIPKMGATDFGYQLARQFGIKIRETRPALTPLLLESRDRSTYCDLAGVSTEVVAATDHHAFREAMLITHQGLSGPAILQVSSYWNKGELVTINLAPDREVFASLRSSPTRNVAAARAALQLALPNRFATRWLDAHLPPRWTNEDLARLEKQLHQWTVIPAGTEGFDKAEVTLGGVDTDELSSKTMESRKVRGLFFIGEVVDVTGHLGGFNFQWAWASGAAAGRSL
ncbi:MAG TPA: NAD(P)/FAD-dependent oxidoreductase [Candidatus Acidoferrum sp.]|nr:NAD(P)/FAD-dependent oxidoreductase [Candidatus Acidoferrum sp.]